MNPKFSTTWKLTQSLSLLKDAQEKINSLTARRVRRSRGWDWREVSCTIVIERVKILTKLIGENPKSPKVAVSRICCIRFEYLEAILREIDLYD